MCLAIGGWNPDVVKLTTNSSCPIELKFNLKTLFTQITLDSEIYEHVCKDNVKHLNLSNMFEANSQKKRAWAPKVHSVLICPFIKTNIVFF